MASDLESHQQWKILHGAPSSLEKGPRTRRKSRSGGEGNEGDGRSSAPVVLPCLAGEAQECAELRSRAFAEVWDAIEGRVKKAVEEAESYRASIQEWVVSTKFSSAEDQQQTKGLAAVKLPTAVVDFGGLGWADNSKSMALLGSHLSDQSCLVARLSPLQLSISGSAGTVASVRSILQQWTGIEPETADMEILMAWYREAGKHVAHFVLLLEEAEACQPQSVCTLLRLLCEWRSELPLVLVIGVGTTWATLRMLLPAAAIARLEIRHFVPLSPQQHLDIALREAVLHPHAVMALNQTAMQFLLEYTESHDHTVAAFIRCLKMATMDHFARQPLSALCHLLTSTEGQGLLEGRFQQLPQVFTEMAASALQLSKPLTKDELEGALRLWQHRQRQWSCALLCLYAASEAAKAVPRGGLLATAVECKKVEEACVSALGDIQEEALDALLAKWEDYLSSSPGNEILPDVQSLRRSLTEGEQQDLQEEQVAGNSHQGNTAVKASTRAQFGLSAQMRRRAMISKAGPSIAMPRRGGKPFLLLLRRVARDASVLWGEEPAHAFFCVTFSAELCKSMFPDQRSAVGTDLLRPETSLSPVTAPNDGPEIPLPDTCLAYALCRRQPCEKTNIMEWYKDFLEHVTGKKGGKYQESGGRSSAKRARKRSQEEVDASSQTPLSPKDRLLVQGRFMRAAAELRLLGVLHFPPRRRLPVIHHLPLGG